MTVHAAPSYEIYPQGEPPDGYPHDVHPDVFHSQKTPSNYEQRRAEYIAHVLRNPAPRNTKPVWYELVRMSAGRQPYVGVIHSALNFIDSRKDCADFVLHGILRMMYSFTDEANHPIEKPRFEASLSPDLIQNARQTILNFKYFPDEPGIDSLCTWTENHYILYTSAAYLAGQLYPESVFHNSGETGKLKIEKNRPRILRWLDLRFRTGFSEWLSHVYYDEDLAALLSLHDFAEDEEIQTKSAMVIDLLLLDMALNSFRGVFGSTHGRAYENTKKWASQEGTTDTLKLLFGLGVYSGYDNMSAPAFALSGYRVPPAIEAIARDPELQPVVENWQRMGIRLKEMERWGLEAEDFEDGMHSLTLEAYMHPRTIENTVEMFDVCNWWKNDFFQDVASYRGLLRALGSLRMLPLLARILERDICRNTREEVNIYTYRTPDTMLSTAQDYRKGFGGDQQHIWQATLGQNAVCFTTHPAKIEGVTPNYWAGSGLLPRAAQIKNLTIAIYNVRRIPALYVPVKHFFTHAWLPQDQFDQVVEQGGWIFARLGDGYLGLYSRNGYFWNQEHIQFPAKISSRTLQALKDRQKLGVETSGEDVAREVIADGPQNIWLCQVGRKADDGSFSEFVQKIRSAELIFEALKVCYQAPGLGEVRFGWEGPLILNGKEIPLNGYPRYRNPYVQADFGARNIRVNAQDRELVLDWELMKRIITE